MNDASAAQAATYPALGIVCDHTGWFLVAPTEPDLPIVVIDPNNPQGYFERAFYWYKLENWDAAIRDLTTIIELDPTNALAYAMRGQIRGERGDHRSAFADSDRAFELDPTNLGALCNRGLEQHELGDTERAIRDYNAVLSHDPSFKSAYVARIRAHKALGRIKEALADCGTLEILCDHALSRDKIWCQVFGEEWVDWDDFPDEGRIPASGYDDGVYREDGMDHDDFTSAFAEGDAMNSPF